MLLCLLGLLAISATPMRATFAQGAPVVDQRNTPATGTTYGCGSAGMSISQSFTPRGVDLVGVELTMRAGGSFPEDGHELEIQIRETDPAGPVIAKAKAMVAGPQTPAATIIASFALTPAPALSPGSPYVIELLSPAPAGVPAATIVSWFGKDGDPYAGGSAFGCTGKPIPDRDLNFITYSSRLAEPGETPPRLAPTPSAPVCWQILGRVPQAAIDRALANPAAVGGYDQLEYPAKPEGPHNRRRRWLTQESLAIPYHPLYNGLIYKGSCP